MANRHLFSNQRVMAASAAGAPIVANPFISCWLPENFGVSASFANACLQSNLKMSWYPVRHQRVEDAAVKERSARR